MLIQDMDQAVSRDKCNHQQITFSFSQTDGYTYFETKHTYMLKQIQRHRHRQKDRYTYFETKHTYMLKQIQRHRHRQTDRYTYLETKHTYMLKQIQRHRQTDRQMDTPILKQNTHICLLIQIQKHTCNWEDLWNINFLKHLTLNHLLISNINQSSSKDDIFKMFLIKQWLLLSTWIKLPKTIDNTK